MRCPELFLFLVGGSGHFLLLRNKIFERTYVITPWTHIKETILYGKTG